MSVILTMHGGDRIRLDRCYRRARAGSSPRGLLAGQEHDLESRGRRVTDPADDVARVGLAPVAALMAGRKTVTRRLVSENPRSPWWRERCSLVLGRDYAVCPGRGKNAVGRVYVVELRREVLGAIDDAEAMREGFENAVAFWAAWSSINGAVDREALVWRVELSRRAPAAGVPVVGAIAGQTTVLDALGIS